MLKNWGYSQENILGPKKRVSHGYTQQLGGVGETSSSTTPHLVTIPVTIKMEKNGYNENVKTQQFSQFFTGLSK